MSEFACANHVSHWLLGAFIGGNRKVTDCWGLEKYRMTTLSDDDASYIFWYFLSISLGREDRKLEGCPVWKPSCSLILKLLQAFSAVLIKLDFATTVMRTKNFLGQDVNLPLLFCLGTKESLNWGWAELSWALFSKWWTLQGLGDNRG